VERRRVEGKEPEDSDERKGMRRRKTEDDVKCGGQEASDRVGMEGNATPHLEEERGRRP
jgi:hypothetical protein